MIAKEIAEALFATALDISKNPLVKDVENKFAKFKYVPIDAYYNAIPKIALKHGLFWRCREQEVTAEGKTIFFKFSFDLLHKSGSGVENFDTVTIHHPAQGPQTAGSARSYAEKLFMRTVFKVVTGEKDSEYFHESEAEDLSIPDADGSNNNDEGLNLQQVKDLEKKQKKSKDVDGAKVKNLSEFLKEFRDDSENKKLWEDTDNGVILKEPNGLAGGWDSVEDIVHTFMPRLDDMQGDEKKFKNSQECVMGVQLFFKINRSMIEGTMSEKSPETFDRVMAMFKAAKTAANAGEIYDSK